MFRMERLEAYAKTMAGKARFRNLTEATKVTVGIVLTENAEVSLANVWKWPEV
jgi:hypothetical protein